MLTVGKSQDPAWKDVLDTKGLSAAATLLEEYGLSCESDMSLVDEEEDRAGGRGVQLRYARDSHASRVCTGTSTHPRTEIPAGLVRKLAELQGRWGGLLFQ